MEEIKERKDGDDILQIVNSIAEGCRKAEGSFRVPGELPRTIYQVPKAFRQVNEKCYEPQLVSIGPYHRYKEGIMPMEEKKSQYLLALLSRNPELELEDFVKEIKKLEAKARKCYSESISLQLKEFVEMMVLDGGFLVELLLRIRKIKLDDEQWVPLFITHDMQLLENQLPFFILQRIFSLVVPEKRRLMKNLLLDCFTFIYILPLNEGAAMKKSYHHVLDMFHHHCLPTHRLEKNYAVAQSDSDGIADSNMDMEERADPDPNAAIKADTDIEAQYNEKEGPDMIEGRSSLLALTQFILGVAYTSTFERPFQIPSAEELDYAGITFKRKETTPGSFLDIKFYHEGAVMKIPHLYFSDGLQTIFRNLIVYEQCYREAGTFFTGYAMFMDDLINTAKDVRILRHARILEHGLRGDEELAQLFNQLSIGIFIFGRGDHIHLCDQLMGINTYCKRPWISWRASWVRTYFYSPWASWSFAGALLGLALTIVQAASSVKSFF